MIKEKAFYRTLLLVAIPTAIQAFISLSVNMLDNIMVGSLGEVALASTSLANQMSTFITFFIKGIAGGSAVLISQYWGKKDMMRIKSVFATVLQFAVCSVFIISTIIFIFPTQSMQIFSNDMEIIQQGQEYIRIIAFSYLCFAVSDTLIAMLRNAEVVKIGMITSFTSLLFNLVLNYIFIFGKLGLPAMGVKGAAIATLITRIIEMCIVCVYVFVIDKRIHLKFKDVFKIDKQMQSDFIKYGMPIVIGDSQWGFIGFFKAMIIGRLGIVMVSANAIAETILALAMIFTNGLSNGACVTVGKAVGAGEYKKAREYSNTIQILFASVGVVMGLLVFFTSAIPPTFYNVSDTVRGLATTFISIGAITHMGTAYHAACFVGINRGAGDGKFVMKIDMICGWFIVLPLTLMAALLKLPLPIVFLMTRIDQCFKWIIALIRLKGDKWMKNVTRA